jgi:hypothetical protein
VTLSVSRVFRYISAAPALDSLEKPAQPHVPWKTPSDTGGITS